MFIINTEDISKSKLNQVDDDTIRLNMKEFHEYSQSLENTNTVGSNTSIQINRKLYLEELYNMHHINSGSGSNGYHHTDIEFNTETVSWSEILYHGRCSAASPKIAIPVTRVIDNSISRDGLTLSNFSEKHIIDDGLIFSTGHAWESHDDITYICVDLENTKRMVWRYCIRPFGFIDKIYEHVFNNTIYPNQLPEDIVSLVRRNFADVSLDQFINLCTTLSTFGVYVNSSNDILYNNFIKYDPNNKPYIPYKIILDIANLYLDFNKYTDRAEPIDESITIKILSIVGQENITNNRNTTIKIPDTATYNYIDIIPPYSEPKSGIMDSGFSTVSFRTTNHSGKKYPYILEVSDDNKSWNPIHGLSPTSAKDDSHKENTLYNLNLSNFKNIDTNVEQTSTMCRYVNVLASGDFIVNVDMDNPIGYSGRDGETKYLLLSKLVILDESGLEVPYKILDISLYESIVMNDKIVSTDEAVGLLSKGENTLKIKPDSGNISIMIDIGYAKRIKSIHVRTGDITFRETTKFKIDVRYGESIRNMNTINISTIEDSENIIVLSEIPSYQSVPKSVTSDVCRWYKFSEYYASGISNEY